MEKKAIISECGKYRYELHRTWDEEKKKVLFIMLNPSTADSDNDDLTTIRCINYAKKWGFGGLMIGNIYPFRAKRPKNLRKWLKNGKFDDKVYTNQNHIYTMSLCADLVVCAWGCNYPGMPVICDEIPDLHYLELCKDGVTPKHPLGNLSKDIEPSYYRSRFNGLSRLGPQVKYNHKLNTMTRR